MEEIRDPLPGLSLEKLFIRVIRSCNGDQPDIASRLFQPIMQDISLPKRNRVVIDTVQDHKRRSVLLSDDGKEDTKPAQ